MRAARIFGKRDVRVVDSPDPEPQPDEILLRVEAVAICPGDLRVYEDFETGGVVPGEPIIAGHEFSGVIERLGSDVHGLETGQRVAVEPSWHCGPSAGPGLPGGPPRAQSRGSQCDVCRAGHENICRNIVFPSFPPRDGAMAELIRCPAFSAHPIPDSMGFVEAALVEPLGVAIHAVRLAGLQPHDRVAVLGAGIIGLCVMQVARAQGIADVIVAEPREARRPLAERLGARLVAPSAAELADSLTDPAAEPRVVFEVSGGSGAIEEAMDLCRPAGTVVVIGVPHPTEVRFDATVPRRKELTVIFSRRSRHTLQEAIELVTSGRVDLSCIPYLSFPLAEAKAAFELAVARPGDARRSVVLPQS